MKRVSIILISFLSFAIMVSAVHSESLKKRQITGNVTAIDTKKSTVKISKKSREVTVNVGEKTAITRCVPETSISDIMIGDKVTATYYESEVDNKGKSIVIKKTGR